MTKILKTYCVMRIYNTRMMKKDIGEMFMRMLNNKMDKSQKFKSMKSKKLLMSKE